ncbi:MAG TPA: NADH-quinone oxidoreductase subunit C [Patescibacteria group bacterium]|nr:NADH-quinone oxidoreductase subunit C [Patescibacteria group bacterium]
MTSEQIKILLPSSTTHHDEIRCHVEASEFAPLIGKLTKEAGLPLSLVYATDDRKVTNTFGVHAVLSLDEDAHWLVVSTSVRSESPSYPSLTASIMAAHWYERYLQDMFGITSEGHPDPRRLVHHENIPEGTHPLRKDFAWNTKLDHAQVPYQMHHVEGEGIYEIPVGPIHAGIIEPGHFRFNVAGERIITLEGKLFFTHKGVEKLLEGKTPEEALPFIERLSGDMAASLALAFCQAVEKISGTKVPERAQALRVALCELERLTMHIHDLANIAGMGTGYSLMAANGFRVKERLMRLSQTLLGNRFWRGAVVPGGVTRDWTKEECALVKETATVAVKEMQDLIGMAMQSDGLRERLETTGILKHDVAIAYGAVGLPARASGVMRDVRGSHPYAAYPELPWKMITATDGDVYARYRCRVDELAVSLEVLLAALEMSIGGSVSVEVALKDGSGIGAVESWRGEILTVVHLKDGKIERCMPRDPSFCNWALFGELGPGNIVPDFPLCNKSLNLSYSGTDM